VLETSRKVERSATFSKISLETNARKLGTMLFACSSARYFGLVPQVVTLINYMEQAEMILLRCNKLDQRVLVRCKRRPIIEYDGAADGQSTASCQSDYSCKYY